MTGSEAHQDSRPQSVANRSQDRQPSTTELLDLKGAAAYLGVPVSYIRRLVLEKRVAYHKVGRYLRFKCADLDQLVDRGRIEPKDEAAIPRQVHNTHLFATPARRPRHNTKMS
jgi:excisionase family DNA binding protein